MQTTDAIVGGLQNGSREDGGEFDLGSLREVMSDLHRIARSIHGREHRRHGHKDPLLQTTFIVNETLVRIMGEDWQSKAWRSAAEFKKYFAAAAQNMITDQARRRMALVRGGGRRALPIADVANRIAYNDPVAQCERDPDLAIRIGDWLDELEAMYPEVSEIGRKADIARQYIYLGLSLAEIGEGHGVSRPTAQRDWHWVRAQLFRYLRQG